MYYVILYILRIAEENKFKSNQINDSRRLLKRHYLITKLYFHIKLKGKFPQTTMWIEYVESSLSNPTVEV